MCWSFEASLFAFVWCTSVAGFLRRRNATIRDGWASKFLFAYGLVQLCDAGFWYLRSSLSSHDPNADKPQSVCDAFNHFLSEYALPTVLTGGVAVQIHQALVHLLQRKDLPAWSMLIFAVWILSAPSRFSMYWGPPPYCTTIYNNRTLLWGDRPANRELGFYWVLGGTFSFAFPFIFMRPLHVGFVYLLLGVVSSVAAYRYEPVAWGSNWCFIAASFSLVFIVEPYVSLSGCCGRHSAAKVEHVN